MNSNLVKKILILFITILFIVGCKKDKPEIKDLFSITLNPVKQSGDTLFLEWNSVNTPFFKSYLIYRATGLIGSTPYVIPPDKNHTKFTDIDIAPKQEISYRVAALLTTGDTIFSNTQFVKTDSLMVDLLPLTTYNDSVKLNWSVNYKHQPGVVTLTRKAEGRETELIKLHNLAITTYTDKNIPYTTEISYKITAEVIYDPKKSESNTQSYIRKDIRFSNVKAFNILFDQGNKLIYFLGKEGDIQIFDLTADKITASINSGVQIGYSDLGIYNNSNELYVPRNDGWIFVYDATTLVKKDQILVGAGIKPGFVVYNNGMLFVNTDAWMNNPLRVYSRPGRNLLSQGGFWNDRRIKVIPGSNSELIEVSMSPSGLPVSYYAFDQSGKPVTEKRNILMNSYIAHGKIFEMFPSGEKFITGEDGNILNKNLELVSKLQNINKKFNSYYFDVSANEILAGTADKSIEIFSMSTNQHIRSINTTYYPYKIFKSDNKILVIGAYYKRDNNYDIPEKLFIEII